MEHSKKQLKSNIFMFVLLLALVFAALFLGREETHAGEGDVTKELYKKQDIEYGYTIDREEYDISPRYSADGKLIETGTADQAVIICAGDLMCEPAMSEAAYFDGKYCFNHFFKYISPVLKSADLALANLETIVSDKIPYAHEIHKVAHETGPRYHCNAPVEYLEALRYAGFDGLVLANNHNADGGYEGIIDTLNNIDEYGFMRTGMFKDADESRVLVVNINNIKVGILSYTEHINRDLDEEILTKKGCEIMLNRYSKEKLKEDIANAKEQGAEFILSYIHLKGKEYSTTVLDRQRVTAQEMADAGVDCVVGTHMHCIQEYDVLESSDGRRVPVMYSLGNFITSDSTGNITRKSVLYKLVLTRENGDVVLSDESYIPCRVVEGTLKSFYTVFPTQAEYRNNRESSLLEQAQEEIAAVIGSKIRLD